MVRRRHSGCGIWLLFWIIIILALLILFLLNKGSFNVPKYFKSYKSHKVINNNIKKNIIKNNIKKNIYMSKKVSLYFVKYIEKSDQLELVPVTRQLKPTNTPLFDTLQLLLKGPTQMEADRGISSVFPANVKIRSVRVSNGIAYIDFNSDIETGVGIPMLQARLYQIIYTATQFSTVDKVRILINGRAKDTFSSEGLSIKHPLPRLKEKPIF